MEEFSRRSRNLSPRYVELIAVQARNRRCFSIAWRRPALGPNTRLWFCFSGRGRPVPIRILRFRHETDAVSLRSPGDGPPSGRMRGYGFIFWDEGVPSPYYMSLELRRR